MQAVPTESGHSVRADLEANRWAGNRLATHVSILAADIAGFWTAFIAAVVIRHAMGGQFLLADYARFVPLLLGFIVVYAAIGLYPGVGLHPVRELRGIVYANSVVYLAMMAGTFLSKTGILFSRLAFTGAWALSILLVILFRNLVRSGLARKRWWGIPVVVFGAGRMGRQVVDLLGAQPSLGLKVAGVLDDDPATHSLGSLALAPLLADRYGLSYAIVAMPGVSAARLHEILRRYAHRFRHFLVIPNIADLGMLWVSTRDLGGVLGLEMSQNLLHAAPRMAKRIVDIVLAMGAAVVLAPALIGIAAAVRLTSRGPVFFSQPRIGKDRCVFRAWKFRTMMRDADRLLEDYFERNPARRLEWRVNRKLREDPRLTPAGRFLRQFSLDELPQLWNVFRGQMSLAGPRPIAADELVRYGEGIELYTKVLPGITGLWQVSGRNDTTYDERVRLDEYYVRNWSVWMDLWILGRTLRCVITRRGAY